MITDIPRTALFSIDTSSLVNSWTRNYPPDMFEPIWRHVEGLISTGKIVSSAEVLRELKRQDDDLHTWCQGREDIFVDLIPDLVDSVFEIQSRWPKIIAAGRNPADPFVIATARICSPSLTVVTEETSHRASDNKPKIPWICQHLGIKCISFVDMLRETKWKLA